ncbi:hypothetical protein [Candidatus Enterovibrio altilux]|uniref:hypothetical protein n=1 Tax=Candidatus Enterovibrio altilux TaxID=1927128 RepID=UPI0013748197|nr:hypothetical protein [Candidatus Enterovibrio luxaltus]
MTEGACYLTCLNRFTVKLMEYQVIVLMRPDNITSSFALNKQFHSSHQEKE